MEDQGIAEVSDEPNIDRIKREEKKIETFGGEDVVQNKVLFTKEE